MSNALFFLKNRADEATVAASSTANASMPATNVQDEQRTRVWRSGTGEMSYLDFTMPANFSITHCIVIDCNLHPSATIRVQSWGAGLDKHIIKSQDNVTFDFTRATVATFVDKTGLVVPAISGAPRFDYDPATLQLLGLLCEPARTNRALHNQDKSNAAWTKTNISVSADTCWDGTQKNIRLTASAANGTITQSITSASVERVYSVAIKRVTGSGPIEITLDNGTSWTDISGQINSSTYKVVSKVQTVLNPIIGIRIVTSGDAINATMDQEETGGRYTSRILTTTAAVARNGDDPNQLLSAISGYSATQGSVVVRARQQGGANESYHEYLLAISDGTANELIRIIRTASSANTSLGVIDGGVSQAAFSLAVADWTAVNRFGLGWQANSFKGCLNGGAVSTDLAGTLPTMTKINIGAAFNSTSQFNGWIQEVQLYSTLLSDADFQAATSGTAISVVPIMDLDLMSIPGTDETVNPTVFVEEDQSSFYGLGSYGSGGYGGTPSNVSPQGKNITLIPFAAQTHRYWRVTFADDATTYQQAGRVFLGTALEFGVNMAYGWSTRQEERSQSRESIGGQRYTQPREVRRVIRGNFDWLTDSERTTYLRNYQRVGDTTPIIFSLIPEASFQGLTTTIYGRLNAPEIVGQFFDVNALNFEVIEEL